MKIFLFICILGLTLVNGQVDKSKLDIQISELIPEEALLAPCTEWNATLTEKEFEKIKAEIIEQHKLAWEEISSVIEDLNDDLETLKQIDPEGAEIAYSLLQELSELNFIQNIDYLQESIILPTDVAAKGIRDSKFCIWLRRQYNALNRLIANLRRIVERLRALIEQLTRRRDELLERARRAGWLRKFILRALARILTIIIRGITRLFNFSNGAMNRLIALFRIVTLLLRKLGCF